MTTLPAASFADHLSDYLERMRQAHARGQSHDYLRHLFVAFLKDAFDIQADEIDIERGVKGLKARGSIDLLFQDLIFEFKRDLATERAVGLAELAKYFQDPQFFNRYPFGFLTDGLRFEVYVPQGESVRRVDNTPTGSPVDLGQLKPPEAERWLDSFLFTAPRRLPTTEDIVLLFGPDSFSAIAAIDRLRQALEASRHLSAVKARLGEWQHLLARIYSGPVDTLDFFVRHTYLAFLARVIAFVTLSQRVPRDDELSGLVNGESFRPFADIVEDDFFAWPLQGPAWAIARDVLRGLASHFSLAYDASHIDEDLLKGLYQQLVTGTERHDLGEFYTPDWLAQLTLEEAGFQPGMSLLDPACGSGTFLFTAIRLLELKGLSGVNLIRRAMEDLAGLDIHPLAVIIARINFLLALAPTLRQPQVQGGIPGGVQVPIYMANTLVRPQQHLQGQVLPVQARSSETFHLPVDLAGSHDRLAAILKEMTAYAEKSVPASVARQGFRNALAQLGEQGRQHLWVPNLDLMRKLITAGYDSLWAFILRNAYQTEVLAQRKFDLVAGNPPWLAYRYIQDRAYQDQVKAMMRDYSLLRKGQTRLITHMELATLFFAHAKARFLTPDGTLAFVMPRSVLTGAKQHEGFWDWYGPDLAEVIDLEGVAPLFNVPACVLIYPSRDTEKHPLKTLRVSLVDKPLPAKNLRWADARPLLTLSESPGIPTPTPIGPPAVTQAVREQEEWARARPYYAEFFSGANLYPRSFWFVQPVREGILDPTKPRLETDPAVAAGAKAPWQGIALRGQVEADFLYATLLGDDLLPFCPAEPSLVVVPLAPRVPSPLRGEDEDGGDAARGSIRSPRADEENPAHPEPVEGRERGRLLTRQDALRAGYSRLPAWLGSIEAVWDARKKPQQPSVYDWINWRQKLTAQHPASGWKVLYNADGTFLAACVVEAASVRSLGPLAIQGFMADYRTYWHEAGGEDEALYLCAVLNAPSVDDAIKPVQTRGAWGPRHIERRPLEVCPIPRFDSANPDHQTLADLAHQCYGAVQQALPTLGSGPIGRRRAAVRLLLALHLIQIDAIVQRLGIAPPPH